MRSAGASDDGELPAAGVPGANNWVPIGPSVVRKGQATGGPPVSGRVSGIAIAPGGSRVYVASADGGVWRSDDGGSSWRPTMDGFDVDPTSVLATSSACGAIAIDQLDPDRIYVGTGEGDTDELFGSRLMTSLPAYRGVGPIVSSNGGASWAAEPTDAPSTSLMGAAFFALAVDPADRERVVAATTFGLYRREPDGAGGYLWARKRTNKHTSVVVSRTGGATTFYAAEWGVGVFSSPDGNTWTALGTGLPAGLGRISLAARPTDPSVLYAYAVTNAGAFEGVHRFDAADSTWRTVGGGLPDLGGQGAYNLPIAVDPNNANTIYIAGSYEGTTGDGAIYRCAITSSGGGPTLAYSMASTFVGQGVHSDVHVLAHDPGDSARLWTGCDGGVFRTTNATAAAKFSHRNTGLATLCGNAFAQHPTQPAVMLIGLQDNGTARYTGEEAWLHVGAGDGGTPVLDWADPNKVILKINRNTYRATDGGQSASSFTAMAGGAAPIFDAPLETTPYNPGSPADADLVAFGSGRTNYGLDLYISSSFGADWTTPVATLAQRIYALAFASANRLYVGTTGGQVYRLDRTAAIWGAPVRIDNVVGGALPIAGVITDIEVDPADASGSSVYIAFGGIGDARHVWHFDGTAWASRSGSGLTALLNSSHNAIVADPSNVTNIYVAADIGVWRSTDSGATWTTMQNGLPDAAVLDLRLHPTTRLLRASTHGRGMFEYRVDPPAQIDTELFIRDTALDVGRSPTVDWLPDPETWPTTLAVHYLSRNIKVDVPTPAGYQTPTNAIDFLTFNDVIVDGSQGTATVDPAAGTVVNRVYVEVHNRGIVKANSVRVMLLLTRPTVALAPLPAGYEANVIAGTAISDANWQTVGTVNLTDVRAGFPQVAAFSLPSTLLPPPASLPAQQHHCLVALAHSIQDAYSSTDTSVDSLTIGDRKVAQRNLQVVAFVGTPPPPGASDFWVSVDLYGADPEARLKHLIFGAVGYKGALGLLLPPDLEFDKAAGFKRADADVARNWAKGHLESLRGFLAEGRFSALGCKRMMADIRLALLDEPRFLAAGSFGNDRRPSLRGLRLDPGRRYSIFVRLDRKALESSPGAEISVVQVDAEEGRVEGGNAWRVSRTAISRKAGRR